MQDSSAAAEERPDVLKVVIFPKITSLGYLHHGLRMTKELTAFLLES